MADADGNIDGVVDARHRRGQRGAVKELVLAIAKELAVAPAHGVAVADSAGDERGHGDPWRIGGRRGSGAVAAAKEGGATEDELPAHRESLLQGIADDPASFRGGLPLT